jgi:hypothetical protein
MHKPKHRRLVSAAPPGEDHPSQARVHYQVWGARHRAPGEADTRLTEWRHVYGDSLCTSPPIGDDTTYCGHWARVVEVYR